MATKKITELTNVTSVQDSDLLIVETSEGTRSVSRSGLLGGKAPSAYVPEQNLLRNSYFKNPVNTNGLNTYNITTHGSECVNGWYGFEGTIINVESDHIEVSGSYGIRQKIKKEIKAGSTYTFVAFAKETVNSSAIVANYKGTQLNASFVSKSDEYNLYTVTFTCESDGVADNLEVGVNPQNNGSVVKIKWFALYEGAYTVKTVPQPLPLGKRIESVNCGLSVHPYNLLDNSDFRNPVNQRGNTAYTTTWGMSIDRWYITGYNNEEVTVNITPNGLTSTTQFRLQHRLLKGVLDSNKKYTGVIYYTDDTVFIDTGNFIGFENEGFDYIGFAITAGKTVKYVALYEGIYDIDTVPQYIPKGYAVELMECKRYYQTTSLVNDRSLGTIVGVARSTEWMPVGYLFSIPMIDIPTVTITYCGTWNSVSIISTEIKAECNELGIGSIKSSNKEFIDGGTYYIRYTANAEL